MHLKLDQALFWKTTQGRRLSSLGLLIIAVCDTSPQELIYTITNNRSLKFFDCLVNVKLVLTILLYLLLIMTVSFIFPNINSLQSTPASIPLN